MIEDNLYLMMNKPLGYVCSAVSDSHKTVYELLPKEMQELVQNAKRGHRLHTIGRLDCNTSGLLLLTTDGNFSHKIAAAKEIGGGGLVKTYKVVLVNPVSSDEQVSYTALAAKGVILPPEKKYAEQKAAPAKIVWCKINDDKIVEQADFTNQCKITVSEGKFHEVRRLFRALGNEVVELERIAIAGLFLPPELRQGEWRELSEKEMNLLL